MSISVGLIDAQRLCVVETSFTEFPAFKHKIANINESRNAAFVGGKRGAKVVFRSRRVAHPKAADTALGVSFGDVVT